MKSVIVFSDDTLISSEIEDFISEYFDVSVVQNEESLDNDFKDDCIVVTLSEFTSKLGGLVRKRDLDVIDFTGLASNYTSRYFDVAEPSVFILEKMFGEYLEEVRGNIYYPACIFGKAGLDDLVEQTRSIFTMASVEPKVLDFQIPFNGKIGCGMGNSSLAKYVESHNSIIPQNFDLRIIPFSTNMIIDVFKPEYIPAELPHLERSVDISSELSTSESGFVAYQIDSMRVTILADYINVIKRQILDRITELTGVMI